MLLSLDPIVQFGLISIYALGRVAVNRQSVFFLESLRRRNLYDDAIIVFLSDHGEGLGDHGEQEHGLFVYDEAIHVPLIVKQESNAGAGRRVRDLVQHIDLVPTILDFVKAPAQGQLRGRSLKPVLEGTGHLPAAPAYSAGPRCTAERRAARVQCSTRPCHPARPW